MFSKKLIFAGVMSSLLLTGLASLVLLTSTSNSVSGDDFEPGRIIDDEVFYNGGELSTAEIQAFLEERMPDCDTNGEEIYSGTTTRAEYAANFGEFPPFTCVRDYSATYSARAADSLCSAIPAGTKTAAQVIHEVSEACGVSARALLVTIEKESGLLTDDWPWVSQYRTIMGYGCPDGAGCDANYYGYYNQMYNAARQFQNYKQNPLNYRHRAGETISVAYHPNTNCGGSNVYIETVATAALYNYTPYQPNSASLNNYPGTGDSCSSYGNRNFWFFFNNWFGSTKFRPDLTISRSLYHSPASTTAGEVKKVSFKVKNKENFPVTIGRMLVAARDEANNNYNFPTVRDLTLQAGEEYTYFEQQVIDDPGNYNIWIAFYDDAISNWSKTFPESFSYTVIRERGFTVSKPNLKIARTLYHSPSSISAGQTKKVSFKIKNNEGHPVTIGRMLVAARRLQNNQNYNFPTVRDLTLQPGETYTYFEEREIDKSGDYRIWIAFYDDAINNWSSTYPFSSSYKIIREREFSVN